MTSCSAQEAGLRRLKSTDNLGSAMKDPLVVSTSASPDVDRQQRNSCSHAAECATVMAVSRSIGRQVGLLELCPSLLLSKIQCCQGVIPVAVTEAYKAKYAKVMASCGCVDAMMSSPTWSKTKELWGQDRSSACTIGSTVRLVFTQHRQIACHH